MATSTNIVFIVLVIVLLVLSLVLVILSATQKNKSKNDWIDIYAKKKVTFQLDDDYSQPNMDQRISIPTYNPSSMSYTPPSAPLAPSAPSAPLAPSAPSTTYLPPNDITSAIVNM